MTKTTNNFDVIIIGSGMGGMSAASLLSRDGYKVLVLEAAHALGGCSSSYYRKGYTFESGATTLIGFDEKQPLRILENELGISLPKKPINPSMAVHIDGKTITRWRDDQQWLDEAVSHFGEQPAQEKFWKLSKKVADVVWKVSGKNNYFPPVQISDWFQLLKNNPRDSWVLPYAFTSVKKIARESGITNPLFYRFLDEQLIISSQSSSDETPFLFGAAAITYTNYTNYYVPGGLIQMIHTLRDFIVEKGSQIHTKERVTGISKEGERYQVSTSKAKTYRSACVISNIPVWNMSEITEGDMKSYFEKESVKYSEAWGAFTMGVATDDVYPDDMPLHHQIHIREEEKTEYLRSDSIFVSLSARGDNKRAPKGERALNISTHTEPDQWFSLKGDYDRIKQNVHNQILRILKKRLPGFEMADIKVAFSATPLTWSKWVYRKKGRVGGIPQSMSRSLLDWSPNQTPFSGLYLAGDTVFPGQGIPGVTLSGINVYYRLQKNHKKLLIH